LRSRRQCFTHQGIGLVIRSLDASFGRFMVDLIRGYQHYLSPYKGYSCAHLRLDGG